MKKFFVLALLFAAYYGHGQYVFSKESVEHWITQQSMLSMSGDAAACEAFATDAQVNLTSTGHGGNQQFEGGKDEACAYIKQTAAALSLLRAQTSMNVEDVSVTRSKFPWLKAQVRYTQRNRVQVTNMPAMVSTSQDELTLERTFSGLKVVRLQSSGKTVLE